MIRFRISMRTTGMHVKVPFESDKKLIQQLFKELSSFEDKYVPKRGWVRVLKKTYATYNNFTNTYGLHRNHYEKLINWLKGSGVAEDEIHVDYFHAAEGKDIELELLPGKAPLDYQVPIIEFLCSEIPIKVLPVPPGTGKTFSALMSILRRKKRAAVIMGAMHLDTWKRDAEKFFVDTSGIKIVRGSAQLKKYIHDGLNGTLKADIFLISVNTIRDYITEYEELGKSTYGCNPIDLYEVLGVDFRIVDEAHENLHFNYKHDIETNTRDCIYLSATIESDIPFTNRLYQTIFPLDRRYTGLEWKPYIDVVAVGYNLNEPRKVKYKGSNGMYNHHVFEEWILDDDKRLLNYLNLVNEVVKHGFIEVYQPGMKILIFFASVNMCKVAADYFGDLYQSLSVTSYNGEDEDHVLHDHDFVCSTIGSSGTGKNVYGLRTVILTVALKSREKNIQVKGRLRRLDEMFPGIDPTFFYLVCKDIGMHINYHEAKKRIFAGKIKSLKVVNQMNRV